MVCYWIGQVMTRTETQLVHLKEKISDYCLTDVFVAASGSLRYHVAFLYYCLFVTRMFLCDIS